MTFEKFIKLQAKAEKLKRDSTKLKFWNKEFSFSTGELIQDYLRIATNNPLAAKHTTEEIKRIESRVNRCEPHEGTKEYSLYTISEKDSKIVVSPIKNRYYYNGYKSVVEKEQPDLTFLTHDENYKNRDNAFSYAEGIIDGGYLGYLKNKQKGLSPEKHGAKKPKAKPPKTLYDIWLPDRSKNKEQYTKYIEFLKREYNETASAFVTETNGKLYWNKIPQRGWQQYMAGFVYTCIKKQWIADQYSAPDLIKILNNTFNAEPNVKWFKSLSANPPNDKYLKPFKNLPANI